MNKISSEYRLLHTMIRVQNLDRSIDFYTRILGMKVIRRKDYKDGEFTNVFVGYGEESEDTTEEGDETTEDQKKEESASDDNKGSDEG